MIWTIIICVAIIAVVGLQGMDALEKFLESGGGVAMGILII
jgi:hypothetical protein